MAKTPANYLTLCTKAARAAQLMKAHTDLEWFQIGFICRDLAGVARTNRAMVRLIKMAKYAEIQADDGTNLSLGHAEKQWASFCRAEAC